MHLTKVNIDKNGSKELRFITKNIIERKLMRISRIHFGNTFLEIMENASASNTNTYHACKAHIGSTSVTYTTAPRPFKA